MALIIFCLFFLLVSIGLIGWGFYALAQQTSQKDKIPSATASAAMQWPEVFSDDFGKITRHWQTGDYFEKGRSDTRSISNGLYTWSLENADGYIYLSPANAGVFKDFAVSVDVRHTAGALYDGYGLIFCNAAGNYYAFAIQDSGYYSVVVWSADKWNLIVPLSRSKAIKPGEFNHLAVLAENGVFKLLINDKIVREFQDSTLTSGDVGLMLHSLAASAPNTSKPNKISETFRNTVSTAEFDNFEVRAPQSSASDQARAPQLPQIKPENGKLVFASDRDGNRNIYTIDTHGKDLKQLTNASADGQAPRWSPDGKKIAFVSNRDGNLEIYIMDADGKNVTRLTDNPAEDISPDWSPDGKQIIFASNRDGRYDLYLMSARGEKENLRDLTNTKFDEMNPSISPDGQYILFQENENNKYSLYFMGIDGKHKNPITNYDDLIIYSDGAWAPDSYRFAYVIHSEDVPGDILVGTPYQGQATEEGTQITRNQGMNLYPRWSPSGKQIVLVSDRDGQSDIYILLADGSGIFRVTYDNAVEQSPDWFAP